MLSLLHSEQPKLCGVWGVLSAVGLISELWLRGSADYNAAISSVILYENILCDASLDCLAETVLMRCPNIIMFIIWRNLKSLAKFSSVDSSIYSSVI